MRLQFTQMGIRNFGVSGADLDKQLKEKITMPSVKSIVSVYLKANGFDGLCWPGTSCECGLDDLMPCESDEGNIASCVPAHKVRCPNPNGIDCDIDCDGHFVEGKRK
jgi:hypothetical protein